ncbi:phospholipid-binding lipoprotein MlaA [Desulfonatronum thiosulfatophilum]|uniref:Phospholipid-binding lipoprotein MlaA n=1 Tax=Desulfonatronum thiosulfatophilum TaxID=617002 RepID=A0A1G6BWM7_9BACT|nr:VacJ family lipoprotein [Desulfonatronum thiosulfatophilum]SDB24998.1 phospholipid-binding lipoprotein MlaA [Desulfonatronum thiosulfatophilum]
MISSLSRLRLISLCLACLLMFGAGCAARNNPNPELSGMADVDSGVSNNPDQHDGFEDDDWWDEEWEDLGETQAPARVADPLERWNRAVFTLNDRLYFLLFKPVGEVYAMVLPKPLRIGVQNFFTNLRYPIRAVNGLLQGKGGKVAKETGSFALNTTFGFLGLVKISDAFPSLEVTPEDTGQTFGFWGVGKGPYIVWPILGPSTLRDSVGLVGDYFLDPLRYAPLNYPWVELKAVDQVNTFSLEIGRYENLKETAIDPYIAMRDAYIQYRSRLVQD